MIFNIPQLSWDLDTLIVEPLTGAENYAIPSNLKQKNYSISLLRYWFIYHFLQAENANHKCLCISEIGFHQSRLFQYINYAVKSGYPRIYYSSWDSLEEVKTKQVKHYDVIILLNISSYKFTPEEIIKELIRHLRKNGVLIGASIISKIKDGKPCQSTIRRKKIASGISLDTIDRIARENDLSIDFLSGGFFKRSSGLIPIQQKRWFRFNLLLGALFPSWAKEIYWVYRK